ncbi:ATP-binding cassette domain-containing protein [Capnocytophaga sp. ARDL2]|uniref:ATP-binding cassette domain-containing protein n=1 Tax=Capnocytophaga sp. ARDL2 TaxID=3238809 RepID=UPI0035577987
MLEVQITEKKYGNQLVLENLNLTITTNGIYGIVGKNGEGKTTLFHSILGIEKHKGKSTLKQQNINLQKAAYCPAEPFIYEELTASEFYDFYAELLNISYLNSKNILFDIPKNQQIKYFSTGMKKKAYLNAIFQKEYSLYVLDEPFNGLDIESNYQLMNYLKEISKQTIILISSHIIDVLYKHCEKIYLLQNKTLQEFSSENYELIEAKLVNNEKHSI